MLFSLAACNDDKEDNGGRIIGLWKITKYEGQVFVDEDISSDPDEEAYWNIKESGIDIYNYYKGKLDGDVEHATYEYDGKTLIVHQSDGSYVTCTIKSLTSSKMKMFIDYFMIVQANVEFERVDALPGEKSSSGSNSGVTYPVFKSGTENGHDYVDLGLTSGTKWATANVGASKPQDYGNYYAWGETTTKETYNWETYKYGSNRKQLTKYCNKSYYGKDGFTDSKTTLDLSDDAAYVNWGGKWRMPTVMQQEELLDECYWVWTESYNNSNVKGYIVYKAKTSCDKGVKIYEGETPSSSYKLSDAHIFLPAAGYRSYDYPVYAGSGGLCWSSSLDTDDPSAAWYVYFGSDGVGYDSDYDTRRDGMSVRAVCK